MLSQDKLKRLINTASKRTPADLVIKNGQIVDVFNGDIIRGDVALKDGMIAGIGSFQGVREIDAQGKYICPGFIDGHVHIESSMVSPVEFAKVVLPHGVTTVVADPHEIANVGGVSAIEYMLAASDSLPLTVYLVLPSCVPCSPFECNGSNITASQLEPLYDNERVIGLGEVMDFPAVKNGEDEMMNKLISAMVRRKKIDGHAAGLDLDGINVYTAAGIQSDHECDTVEAARIRLQRGMYLMIREGSVAKDLKQLITVVNERNARRCLFVTDDKDLEDLLTEGSIDHSVRLAIQQGIEPLTAIQMGTLNAAECFGLTNKGAIAPGYDADFLLLNDLVSVDIAQVYCQGELVAENNRCLKWDERTVEPPTLLRESIKMKELSNSDLEIRLKKNSDARVIRIIPNSLFTEHIVEKVDVIEGIFQTSVDKDLLKLVVVERHHQTGNIGLGIVKGFGLKSGSLATTVAHDSHNLIAVGTNNSDLLTAIRTVQKIKGGFVIVQDGNVLASLPLPIGGLMADHDYQTVVKRLKECRNVLQRLDCCNDINPLVSLSFLSLPVIPELKLTATGLIDVTNSQSVAVEVTS